MTEVWKPIKDYEGLYSVSNFGRVRSEARMVNSRYGQRRIKERILMTSTVRGYQRVSLRGRKGQKSHRVHRLVAIAFIDNPDKHSFVLHGPSGQADNSVDNLYWGGNSQNMLDRKRDGTCHSSNKTHCPLNHEYFKSNTMITRKGHRRCRSCDAARKYLSHRPDSAETVQQVSDRLYFNKYN